MKNTYRLFIISLLLLTYGCSISQDGLKKTSSGAYKQLREKSKTGNHTVVYGTIFEYKTNEVIHYPVVQVNSENTYKGDSNGYFKFTVVPGKYHFTGKGYPYLFVETDPITIKKGDSVKLVFYLKPYTKPLVD